MPSHFKLFSRCRGGNTVRNGGNNMHSDACAAEAATRKTDAQITTETDRHSEYYSILC